MKVVRYEKILEDSFRLLRKNLIILLPHIIVILVSLFLVFLFFKLSGIWENFIENINFDSVSGFALSMQQYIIKNINEIIGLLVLILIAQFIIDLYFSTMKYGMIKDVILKRRTSLLSGIKFANTHLFSVISIHFLCTLIIFGPIFAVGFFFVLLFGFKNISAFLFSGIFLFCVIVYILFILFRLTYVYPVMAFEEQGPIKSIKKDFHYVKTHLAHSLLCWAIGTAMIMIILLLKLPLKALTIFLGLINSIPLLIIIIVILVAIEAIITTWEHLFIFNTYLIYEKKIYIKKQ